MLKIAKDRVNVLGASAGGQGLGELVKVGAGDLADPLVLKALKGVPLELERGDLEERQDRREPGAVRLSPQVGQDARQSGLYLGL